MGFPTKKDHFGVFWGYHHLRKHPYALLIEHARRPRPWKEAKRSYPILRSFSGAGKDGLSRCRAMQRIPQQVFYQMSNDQNPGWLIRL